MRCYGIARRLRKSQFATSCEKDWSVMVDRSVLVAVAVAILAGVACRGRQPGVETAAATYDGRITLGVFDRFNDAPSVAALGQVVAISWNARTEHASDVFVRVSTDAGATFGPPMRVNHLVKDANVSGEQPARIAVASGNVIHVVWPSRDQGRAVLRYASSTDLGRTFSKPSTIVGEREPGIRGWHSIAIGYDGGVHVLWLDGRNAAPAAPHQHSASDGQRSAAGTMKRQAPRQDLFHASWKDGGSRTETAVAANVCFCCKTAIATAGDRVYAAWRHIFPGSVRDIAVARSIDNGATFAVPARLSEDTWKIEACPDDGPSMAADSHGGIHVAWPTLVPGEPARKGIFYAALPHGAAEGATFSPRLRLDAGDADPAHPQIASDDHGNVAVVWDERVGDRRRIVLRRIASGAAAPAQIFDGVGLNYPAVAAAAGHWIVAWPVQTPEGLTMIEGRRIPFGN
jgi:hypothetical protein